MKKEVLDKINALNLKAKRTGRKDVKVKVASGETALSRIIKTKEQGDLFMKRLKALEL